MFRVLAKSVGIYIKPNVKILAARTMSSVVNRIYLFNYFEKAPVTDELFESIWVTGGKHVQKSENFLSTYLHKSADPSAKHPYVNFALTDGYDVVFFAKPDEIWMNYMKEVMAHKLKAAPAPYKEIASFKGEDLTTVDKDFPEVRGIFLTSVKVDEAVKDDEVLQQWKTLTGAEILHEKLGNSVIDSHLYKIAPFENMKFPPKFQYTVRTVVKDIEDSVANDISKEINKRTTPSGIESDTAFYRIVQTMKKI